MNRRRLIGSSAVLALSLVTGTRASAETATATPSAGSDLQLDDIPGLETGYARLYAVDVNAVSEEQGADFDPDTLVYTTAIYTFTFDTKEHAANAIGTYSNDFAIITLDDANLEPREIDGLGDRAIAYAGESTSSGRDQPSDTLLVQDDTMMHIIWSIGGDGESGAAMNEDIGAFMVERDIETEQITLDDGGESTGGVFDLMPTEDNQDVMPGMIPNRDWDVIELANEES